MTKKTVMHVLIIVLALVIGTVSIAATGLDVAVSRFFYIPGAGFYYGNIQPWRAIYQYGEWPALLMASGALLALIVSLYRVRLRPYRLACSFLVLLYLIGPGVVVNVVLKDHWGRPRPEQTEAFGGSHPFSQPWEKTDFSGGRSFPSGHSSVAFYMMAPYFLLRRTRKNGAYIWLSAGLAYGILMGIARVIQGGHFVSDVLWAAGIVYLTGLVLVSLMGLDAQSRHSHAYISDFLVSQTIPRDHA